jgi:predicted MPP superfamily phosphohydrolase
MDTYSPNPKWKIINDPGAWGAREPQYLVLGFSKGATQSGMYDKGRFEDVAFAGMRKRLTHALRLMNVIGQHEEVDDKISDPHSNFAFGSLIRCSVSRIDEKASAAKGIDVFACTGPLITKSFTEIPQIISACSKKYLSNLPASVKTVFMLGNGDAYVENCQQLLKSLFRSDFRKINSMAVHADGRRWVHLAHPSGLNGHFKTWANEDSGSGLKRIQAFKALYG